MRRWIEDRLGGSDAGLTLIEMLVAAAIGVVVLGATSTMLISAVRSQPKISDRAEDASTARWVLERMTREIRNGIAVQPGSSVSTLVFTAHVRSSVCGSGAVLPAGSAAIECKVTYSCSTTGCTRSETTPAASGSGTPVTIFTGVNSNKVFSYSPGIEGASFVGVTLRFPNPDGGGNFTISDGATLRGADPFGE
jgi:prepilin-type N-terminal cleavage/methylation domain-containing protein